ncbi:hypothetical protein ACLMJK_002573 [Lecanora helva]
MGHVCSKTDIQCQQYQASYAKNAYKLRLRSLSEHLGASKSTVVAFVVIMIVLSVLAAGVGVYYARRGRPMMKALRARDVEGQQQQRQ